MELSYWEHRTWFSEVDFTIIGRVLAGDENVLIKDNSIINLDDQGYEHFRR